MDLEVWKQFVEFCAAYLATLFGRAVLCSFFLLAVVLALRRTIFRKAVFLKGFLWALFLLAPFVGKLKLFYENPFAEFCHSAPLGAGVALFPVKALAALAGLFFQWGNVCIAYPWVFWIYLLGAGASLFLMGKQRRRVGKLVSKMKPYGDGKGSVVVCEWAVSPFSIGLLRPKVVLPELVLEHCAKEEVELMALHEKMHIRLLHLWCYFLWDLLRCLFWPNVFLIVCTKQFREDLEDICDRVTIQKSGCLPCDYGKLLLKAAQLLQEEPMASTAAFAGQEGFAGFRRRLQRVLGFRPYRKAGAACLCGACFLAFALLFAAVKQNSYPKYVEIDSYILVSSTGDRILSQDSVALRKAVSRDARNVYIARGAMDALLQKEGIAERTFYLGFGGYMKLPGMGGGGCSVYVDYGKGQNSLAIPYQEPEDLLNKILKVM